MPKYTPCTASLSLFDGKVCTRCGLWHLLTDHHRDKNAFAGRCSRCRFCIRAAQQANREHNNTVVRAYRARNKERDSLYHSTRRREQSEYVRAMARARQRKYLAANPNYYRDEYRKNPERGRQQAREWIKRNPEYARLRAAMRRANLAACAGVITVEEWQRLKERYDFTCLRCRQREPDISLAMDHVIPLAKGGPHTIENIQPLCKQCNSSKHTQETDYR